MCIFVFYHIYICLYFKHKSKTIKNLCIKYDSNQQLLIDHSTSVIAASKVPIIANSYTLYVIELNEWTQMFLVDVLDT